MIKKEYRYSKLTGNMPLHQVSVMNGTVRKILITMIIMTGIAGAGMAQDSVGTQNFPDSEIHDYDYADSGYSKFSFFLSPFWRNYLSQPRSSFWKKGAGLSYRLEDGTVSDISTIGFAANIAFNVNSNIGIVSGLEIVNYGGKATGNFTETYSTYDANGDMLDFTYSLKDYREQQRLMLLSVPLMVRFSTPAFSDVNIKYFVACGFKIGIPVVQRATITPGSVTTTGYFHRELALYEDFPEQGFVNGLTGITRQSSMDFRLGVAAALETGLIFMSSENISAGASIYCDIGLNNILKRDNRHIVEYQRFTPGQLRFNSIMKTKHVSSVETLSIGLKLSIYFSLDKKENKKFE
jgi:hypothetical protein